MAKRMPKPGTERAFPWRPLIQVAGAFALVVATLLLGPRIPGLKHLMLQAGTSGVLIRVDADEPVVVEEVMATIAERPELRAGLLDWLKGHWDTYQLTDADLVRALVALCPEFPQDDVAAYQQYVEACDAREIIGELRDLASERAAPFQRKAKQVTIGTPADVPIADDQAYTCFGGEWEHKRLRLLVSGGERQVEVVARGGYDCLPGVVMPDLQINERQAYSLFGRRTRKTEQAIAVVM